jgi:hypothetical protein
MRRMMLFVTLVLVTAAMIAAGAMPTFAKQTKGEGGGLARAPVRYPVLRNPLSKTPWTTRAARR